MGWWCTNPVKRYQTITKLDCTQWGLPAQSHLQNCFINNRLLLILSQAWLVHFYSRSYVFVADNSFKWFWTGKPHCSNWWPSIFSIALHSNWVKASAIKSCDAILLFGEFFFYKHHCFMTFLHMRPAYKPDISGGLGSGHPHKIQKVTPMDFC